MTYLGVDTVHRFTAEDAKKAIDNGVSFVGRYLVPEGMGKELTQEEAANLRKAGLAILLCWEIGAEAFKQGATRGAQDGARARALAESFGIPSGTCIYFACDYNIPDRDLIQAEQYMKAAQAALGKYEAGAYGPLKLVEFLRDRGTCSKFWQCVAWSPYFSPDAQTWQYQWSSSAEAKDMAAKLGFAVDLNTCDNLRKAGFWMPWNAYNDGDGTVIEPAKPALKPMWYDEAMEWAEEHGIMNDGRPNDYVTRAEDAVMFQRFYQLIMADVKEQILRLQPEDDKTYSGLLN